MTHPHRAARALTLVAVALAAARLGAVRAGDDRGVDVRSDARTPLGEQGFERAVDGAIHDPSGGLADRACAGPATYHPARVDPVFLPALDAPLGRQACASAVRVQNVGASPGRVMLWLWGTPGDCFVACRPPLAVVCSGLIGPGGTWDFGTTSAGWPEHAGSAAAFSVAASVTWPCVGLAMRADVDDAGDAPPPRTPSCGEYRTFRAAWDSGAAAGGGVPLATAYGPPIVASIVRTCPSPSNKLVAGVSAYEGAAGRQLAGYDRVAWVGTYAVPAVRTAPGADETWLSVQNAGSCCAAVDIWFQARDACQPDALCYSGNVPPGASVRFRASDCRAAFDGSAWIRGSEPLAVVVDVVGAVGGPLEVDGRPSPDPPEPAAGLATYVAPPADLRRSFDARPVHTSGGTKLYGPWLRGGADVRSRLTIQNMAGDRPARVRVTVRAAGQVITHVIDLCPRGSLAWTGDDVGAQIGRPRGWVGDVTVESVPDPASFDAPPNLIAVAEVRAAPRPVESPVRTAASGDVAVRTMYAGDSPVRTVSAGESPARMAMPGRDEVAGALTYELSTVPDHSPPKTPTRLIAVPRVGTTGDPAPGMPATLIVADLGGGVGGTAFGLFVFDANGLVSVRCHRLPPYGQLAVSIPPLHGRGASFRGAALISAASWDRTIRPDGPAAAGSLAVLAVDDVASPDGDIWTAAAGIPLPPGAPIARVLAATGPLACAAGDGWGVYKAHLPVLRRTP